MKKSKTDLVRGWLEKARHDLKVAQTELDRSEPFTDVVCFHAQQAAEKYLRAYLMRSDIEFPKTHVLEQLVLLAAQKDQDLLTLKDEVALLTPYAVETRYPEFEEPLLEDAQEVARITRTVQRFILQRLPEEVKSGNPW